MKINVPNSFTSFMLPSTVTYCADAYEAVAGADVLVLITEWNEFRALSPARLAEAMRGRLMMDLRNVFDPAAMQAAGFDYRGIGGRLAAVVLTTEPLRLCSITMMR